MSSGGKGDKSRPYSVDQKTFNSNWDTIFKKRTPEDALQELSNLSQELELDKITENPLVKK